MFARVTWIVGVGAGYVAFRATHDLGTGWAFVIGFFLLGIVLGLMFDK